MRTGHLLSVVTKSLSVAGLVATPVVAFAAPGTFRELVILLLSIMNPLVALLTSLAVLIFFWGIVKYIYSPGGEGYEEGRTMMTWGLIALFVLFCVFGITQVLVNFIKTGAA